MALVCALAPLRGWSASCDPAPSGLVSWWAAEGNANDSFGTNNGTLQSGVTFTNGEVGQAFNFNGSNQWVDVPNGPAPESHVEVSPLKAGSNLLGTVHVELYHHEPNGRVVGVDYRSYGIGIIPDLRPGLCHRRRGAPGKRREFFKTFNTTGNVVALNVWTHIAAVYNQSNGVRSIFVNGVNIANQTNTPITVLNTPLDLSIGAALQNSTTPTGFFIGAIDEVSFYNRALSGPEIQAIYNAGVTGKCPSPPVIASQPSELTR